MAEFKFEVGGIDRVMQSLDAYGQRSIQALGVAIHEEAEEIMLTSKDKYVPIEMSALKNSGFVANVERHGDTVDVTMGYGGPAAPYALTVHEDLTMRHGSELTPPYGPKPPDQQAKFLETPTLEALPGMPDRIAGAMRQILR